MADIEITDPDALLELIAKLRTKAREIAESKRSVDLSWDALGQFDEGANLVSAVKTQTTEVTARLDAIQVALSNLASAAQKAHQLYTGADSDVAAGMQSITTNLDSIPAVLSQSAASTAAANELAGDVVTAAVTDHLVHPLQDAMPWLFGGTFSMTDFNSMSHDRITQIVQAGTPAQLAAAAAELQAMNQSLNTHAADLQSIMQGMSGVWTDHNGARMVSATDHVVTYMQDLNDNHVGSASTSVTQVIAAAHEALTTAQTMPDPPVPPTETQRDNVNRYFEQNDALNMGIATQITKLNRSEASDAKAIAMANALANAYAAQQAKLDVPPPPPAVPVPGTGGTSPSGRRPAPGGGNSNPPPTGGWVPPTGGPNSPPGNPGPAPIPVPGPTPPPVAPIIDPLPDPGPTPVPDLPALPGNGLPAADGGWTGGSVPIGLPGVLGGVAVAGGAAAAAAALAARNATLAAAQGRALSAAEQAALNAQRRGLLAAGQQAELSQAERRLLTAEQRAILSASERASLTAQRSTLAAGQNAVGGRATVPGQIGRGAGTQESALSRRAGLSRSGALGAAEEPLARGGRPSRPGRPGPAGSLEGEERVVRGAGGSRGRLSATGEIDEASRTGRSRGGLFGRGGRSGAAAGAEPEEAGRSARGTGGGTEAAARTRRSGAAGEEAVAERAARRGNRSYHPNGVIGEEGAERVTWLLEDRDLYGPDPGVRPVLGE